MAVNIIHPLAGKVLFGVASAAVIGTVAITNGVFADTTGPQKDNAPTAKDQCKNGGYSSFGFKNQGQCVSYVVKASKAGGYGADTQGDALAAADALTNDFANLGTGFRDKVNKLLVESSTTSGAPSFNSFKTKFESANVTYDASIAQALSKFKTDVESAKSTAVSKDQFIDKFNHAKADYFNALEAAKNKLADELNGLGGNDVVKDHFMNSYNALKDAYGNDLEMIKNEFAATIG